MPRKIYRPVAVADEEDQQSRSSSDTIFEGKAPLRVRFHDDNDDEYNGSFERDVRTRTLDFISRNWTWIAHTVLLSLSLTFFALALCQRTAAAAGARISDLEVTQQYASWCMSMSCFILLGRNEEMANAHFPCFTVNSGFL